MEMTIKELRARLFEVRDQEQVIKVGTEIMNLFGPHVGGLNLSEGARNLFMEYAKDAGNWSGTPLVGGNIEASKRNSGYLLQLKKQGLIKTYIDDGRLSWMIFTDRGIDYARAFGVEIQSL